MRAPTVAIAALLLLPGCLGGDAPLAPPEPAPPRPSPAAPAVPAAEAPDLVAGTSWTFRTSGVWDGEDEVTVVVARADADGYLFAAASEEDLPTEIVWGRAWFGPRDRELTRVDAGATTDAEVHPYFEFPLEDGKTWGFGEGRATARLADVAIPGGREEGFSVTAGIGNTSWRWTYAPSVGFFTHFERVSGGVAYVQADLVRMGTSAAWVWYKAGPTSGTDGAPADTGTLDVPAGTDAVAYSVGGMDDGRAVITPPPASGSAPLRFDFPRGDSWEAGLLAGTAGTWSFATQDGDGYAYVGLAGVKWVQGD